MDFNYYTVFTNPITERHVVGKPDGPPVAKFKKEDKKAAKQEAARRTRELQDSLANVEMNHRPKD